MLVDPKVVGVAEIGLPEEREGLWAFPSLVQACGKERQRHGRLAQAAFVGGQLCQLVRVIFFDGVAEPVSPGIGIGLAGDGDEPSLLRLVAVKRPVVEGGAPDGL